MTGPPQLPASLRRLLVERVQLNQEPTRFATNFWNFLHNTWSDPLNFSPGRPGSGPDLPDLTRRIGQKVGREYVREGPQLRKSIASPTDIAAVQKKTYLILIGVHGCRV